jgi:hypothetical protein
MSLSKDEEKREPPITCEVCKRRFFVEPRKTYESHLRYCRAPEEERKVRIRHNRKK